jgi:hypothetical protein
MATRLALLGVGLFLAVLWLVLRLRYLRQRNLPLVRPGVSTWAYIGGVVFWTGGGLLLLAVGFAASGSFLSALGLIAGPTLLLFGAMTAFTWYRARSLEA